MRNKHGYTLIEMVIVVAIMALLLSAAQQLLVGTSRTYQKTTSYSSQLQQVQMALSIIEQDIQQMLTPLRVDELTQSVSFARRPNELIAGITPYYSRIFIRYQIDKNALLRTTSPPKNIISMSQYSMRLLENVHNITLAQWDGQQWATLFDADAPVAVTDTTSIPKAIKITLQHVRYGDISRIIRVAL